MNKSSIGLLVGLVIGAVFFGASSLFAAPFPYATGGTGTTTAQVGRLIYGGATAYQSVATTTASCSGSTTCSDFTVIGSSPITISSSGGGAGLSTSSPIADSNLLVYSASGAGSAYGVATGTVSSANTALTVTSNRYVVGGALTLTVATTTNAMFTGTPGQVLAYTGLGWTGVATTTFSTGLTYSGGAVTVNTSQNIATLSNLTSNGAILTSGGVGTLGIYGGTSCTNQFVRSLSGSIAATCATVSASDVSLANLTATDSTLTFSGTYNGSTARTIGLNLGNANTWSATQTFGNLIATNASTTNMSASAYLGVNTNAVRPNWAWTVGGVATSTAGTGTTTIPAVTFPAGVTITDAYCNVSGVGTWDVQLSYGPSITNLAMIIASSTNYKVVFGSNNTPAAGATSTLSFGTAASSPVYTPNCTFEGTWNNSL